MRNSIIQSNRDHCFICGSRMDLEEHHCWHGTANRRLADADNLVVTLCHKCHADLHDKGYMDKWCMSIAQTVWCRYYGKTLDDFRKRYGKTISLDGSIEV